MDAVRLSDAAREDPVMHRLVHMSREAWRWRVAARNWWRHEYRYRGTFVTLQDEIRRRLG